MNLCSDHHDEICFEGRTCPLCEVISEKKDEIEQKDNLIAEKNEFIESLQGQLTELNQNIRSLEGENSRILNGRADGER